MQLTKQQEFDIEGWALDEATEDFCAPHTMTSVVMRAFEHLGIEHSLDDAIRLATRFVDRWHDWHVIRVEVRTEVPDPMFPTRVRPSYRPLSAADARRAFDARDTWVPGCALREAEIGLVCNDNAQGIFYAKHPGRIGTPRRGW